MPSTFRCPFCEGGPELETPVYRIDRLVHRYGSETVLTIEDLAVAPASITGLVGPNGSGKSTLLQLLAFVHRPSEGEIRFQGAPAAPFSERVRFRVTLLSQEAYLLGRSVRGNIAYGLRLRGRRGDLRDRIAEALDWVGLPAERFARRPAHALSGGETQRVALAARLALRPEVLLLDEPTASVDAASAQLIQEASLRARTEWGTTLVIAGHDRQWLHQVCDRILHLYRGRLLGPETENLLFGPWRPAAGGIWEKELPDGQRVRAVGAPGAEATAMVDPDSLEIRGNGPREAGGREVLAGRLSRLVWERPTGRIVATLIAGEIPFTVRLTPEGLRRLDLRPGDAVSVVYDPRRIRWV